MTAPVSHDKIDVVEDELYHLHSMHAVPIMLDGGEETYLTLCGLVSYAEFTFPANFVQILRVDEDACLACNRLARRMNTT